MNDSFLNAQIRRLADGELDEKDRVALLARADEEPQLYRNIALAFVETQVLDDQLRQMTPWLVSENEPTDFKTTTPDALSPQSSSRFHRFLAGNNAPRNLQAKSKGDTQLPRLNGAHRSDVTKDHETRATKSTSQTGRSFILRIAATVSLAILTGSIGYLLGESNRSGGNDSEMAQNVPTQDEGLDSTSRQATNNDSETTNESDQTQQNIVTNVTNPLVASGIPPTSIQRAIDERLRMELLRNGFVINENTQLLKVEVDEGRTVDLPVRKIEVNYLGNRVYQ